MNIRSCVAVAISLLIVSAAMADKPKAVEKAMEGGQRLLIAGDVDGAIAAYTEAIRLNPRNAEAYKERARTYAVKAAPERFPYLWTTWPRDVLDRYKHHDTKSLSDSRKNEIADLTEAIRLAPNDSYARIDRARIYEEQGDLNKAISDYTEVIRLISLRKADIHLNTEALLARAWLLGKKGELDKAILDYTEVIRLRPHDAYARCCRSGMCERRGNLGKAIADCNEAVQLRPDNAYMYLRRAHLYGKLGEVNQGIADCTEAILLKPDFAAAYDYRATLATKKGDLDAAITDATAAIRLAPSVTAFYDNRGLAFAKKGDHKGADENRDSANRLRKTPAAKKDGPDVLEIVRTDAGELVFADPLCSKYVPSIDNGNGSHRFSESQLKEMAKMPLDRGLFLRYIEAKWPLDRVKTFCVPEHRFPEGEQNLVPDKLCFGEWEIPVHKGKQHDFDRIYVYVSEDDGKSNYYGSVTPDWHQWEYSLNIVRGKDHWAIIESLPNDFMDNPAKYLPKQAGKEK